MERIQKTCHIFTMFKTSKAVVIETIVRPWLLANIVSKRKTLRACLFLWELIQNESGATLKDFFHILCQILFPELMEWNQRATDYLIRMLRDSAGK
jgi:hypothetical protein